MGSRSQGEWARHWRPDQLPGVELLRARYVGHTFPRHRHEGYTLAAVTGGVETVGVPGGTVHAVPGDIVLINPDVPHTAHAGSPEGWSYATLYPDAGTVRSVAEQTTGLRGTPAFDTHLVTDPASSALLTEVHRAAEAGNALAADTLLHTALAGLLHRHGGSVPERRPPAAGRTDAARARAVLEERLAAPPTLERLAAELGTGPFALLRAFRAEYGMPPHAWLTDTRVRAARRLLETGVRPAEAATAVGFTDQAHLGRHFRRIVGVPPGAYRRERAGMYKTAGGSAG